MLTLIAGACASLSTLAAAEPAARRVLEPFDYHGVVLERGPLARQFAEVCEYYLRIPNEDLLKPYRQRAGKPAPGADLGGCYIGHNPFGQFLSGLSRMYAATGDEAFRAKAVALMEGWAECLAPDGFFFVEPNPQLIPYYYDKMVCGLVDLATYCREPRALEHLARITAWADEHLSRVRLYANPLTNDGGEWYTLSENLYRAFLLTGDKRYEALARTYEYREYWDFFAQSQGTEIFTKPGWYHAYSHVNTFCGLGAGYLAEGDAYYLDTLVRAYDYLQEHQCWATGGYGPNESLLPRDQLAKLLTAADNHFETQCGSWAGFKLTRYLISFTGNARFGDWTEKLLLNGIGASIPMSGDGKPFYYSEYSTRGSQKRNINAQWPCCSGTRPQAVADYHDLLYFHDADSLYVSQFAPSTVTCTLGGTPVTIRQDTRFPEEDHVRLTVHLAQPAEFGLAVRVPGWLAGPLEATLNGAPLPAAANDQHWAAFRRTWTDGDVLDLRLPMQLWVSRFLPDAPYPAAIMYGPVALAVRPAETNPAAQINLEDLANAFMASPGDPLTWTLAADPTVLLKPFYAYKEGERYVLYLDPAAELRVQSCRAATYTGDWTDFGGWKAAPHPGSALEVGFTGQGIRLHFGRYDDSGRFEVLVDGARVGVLDEYGPVRGEAAQADFAGLAQGHHMLRLVALEDHHPSSKGTWVNITRFESLD